MLDSFAVRRNDVQGEDEDDVAVAVQDEASVGNDNLGESVVVADSDEVKKPGNVAAGTLFKPSPSFNNNSNPQRVCAICVKEVALPDAGGPAHSIDDIIARMGPMSLRQRKGLERQLLRQQQEEQGGSEKAHASSHVGESDNNNGEQEEDDDDSHDDDSDDEEEDNHDDDDAKHDIRRVLDDCDEDDPFLLAIGGADKLLVGDAYQKMLLSKVSADRATDTTS